MSHNHIMNEMTELYKLQTGWMLEHDYIVNNCKANEITQPIILVLWR